MIGHRFDSPEKVLWTTFWGLVWTSSVETAGGRMNRVDQIVKVYSPG